MVSLPTLPTVSEDEEVRENNLQDFNRIRRIDEEPNMFYEVQVELGQADNEVPPIQFFNTNSDI